MIRWLRERWRARLRRMDRALLWPQIIEQAPNREAMLEAMLIVMLTDPAWHAPCYEVADAFGVSRSAALGELAASELEQALQKYRPTT